MNLNDFSEFKERGALNSLKNTSYNSASDTYMVDSSKMVIDFDQAKTNYCTKIGISNEMAASADALCEVEEDYYYLVEFKDGNFETLDIRKKAVDSVAVMSGITGKDLNYIREHTSFILVFNSEKHRLATEVKRALAMANKGKVDFAIFGLWKLRGFYYNKVYAIEKNKFCKSSYFRDIENKK